MEHERTIPPPSLDPSRASPCASAAGSPRAPHLPPAETPPAWMIEAMALLAEARANERPYVAIVGHATEPEWFADLARLAWSPAHGITIGDITIPVVTSEAMAEGDWRLVSDGEVAR